MNKVFYKARGFKKFSSVLLLFVFTVGITPKITLHNWFATHKDNTFAIPCGNTLQITKAGFNCDCNNLVAESHFITFGSPVVIDKPPVHPVVCPYIPSFVSSSLFHNSLRGPPLKS